MAFAQGSRTGLSYITETTYGTTPAGNFTQLPFTTHSLNKSKDRVQGQDIYSDRMPRVDRHGNVQAGGDIVADLRKGNYDDFIESAMFSTFATDDTITVGTTLKSFSIEDALNDISQFRLFTGMAVSSMSISMAPNQMVTTTFSFVGSDMTLVQSGKTVDSATVNQPFDAYSGDISIGSLTTADACGIITAIDFTIDNSLAPTYVIGCDNSQQLEYGRAEVTGSLTAYFEDEQLSDLFLNETESSIQVSVDDPTGTNSYTFDMGKVKFNSADAPLENPQSRLITMEFVALYDATDTSNLVITRTS